jgi:glycerol uptake facilitator-like aquaporin
MTAEFAGTAFLVAAVVGSGIMAERLAGGNVALALLANTIATGAALVALILAFAPISGAHFNPAVSFAAALEGKLPVADASAYIAAQIAGGISGTMAAHIMFSLPLVSLSQHARGGSAQAFSEFIATFGLLAVIWGTSARARLAAFAVGAYITSAYWFTASTSFANPAVTIARSLSNTFAGIRPPTYLISSARNVSEPPPPCCSSAGSLRRPPRVPPAQFPPSSPPTWNDPASRVCCVAGACLPRPAGSGFV